MKSLLPLLPFVAALGLISCQGDDGPVARDVAAPPDNVVGDAGASGLAAPTNAAAAEAVDRAAAPVVSDGSDWTSPSGARRADFGPVGAAPMLSFECRGEGPERFVLVKRMHPAHSGNTATLSFTGGGHASSLPMHAVAKPGGPGESEWQGEARGDMKRAVARAFSGEGLVNVTLGGAPALAVPTSLAVKGFFARCA
jgi:hypothetical protein